MRCTLLILVLTTMTAISVRAQEYTVTATGTTNPTTSGTFSTVPTGTQFTFTLTFNASTAAVTTGTTYTGAGVQNYLDPLATASATFGTFSFSGAAQTFQVFSGYEGGIYGYEFGGSVPSGVNFSILLQSADASVAPDTSLGSIQTSPIADFGPAGPDQNTHVFELNTPGGDIGGAVNDFSVTTAAVPEPASFALGVLVMIAFGLLRLRARRLTLR